MKPALLAMAFACACQMATSADPPAPPVPSEERIRELVKKLETPTRKQGDQREGPPDYAWDPFDYQIPGPEVQELRNAGEAAVPAVLALLNDKTKPGQTRGFAVYVLTGRMVGAKTKPDPKIMAAIIAALKETDAAVRYGVLSQLGRFGLGNHQRDWELVKDRPEIKNARPPVIPPEERCFNAEVMDALLPAIVAALADENRKVCVEAACAIKYFGRPKYGVPELLTWMKQPENWKRTTASDVLSMIATDDPDALRAVLREFEQGKGDPKDKYYDASIIESVGRFGSKAKPAVEKLVAFVKNPRAHEDRDVCRNIHDSAVDALRQIGPDAKAAVPVLLGCLQHKIFLEEPGDYYIGSREAVLRALDKIDPKIAEKSRAEDKLRREAHEQWFREKEKDRFPKKDPLP
jgi:HEAT repeat protein